MSDEEYEYARFWIRVGAQLIDILLLTLVTLPLTFIIYGNLIWESEAIILGPSDFLINWVFPIVAVISFWFYKSATPGKMAFAIKIVNAENRGKLSMGQSIGRYFAYIPAIIPLGIGIFWVAFDKRKQGWHDKLAGTIVIRTKKE